MANVANSFPMKHTLQKLLNLTRNSLTANITSVAIVSAHSLWKTQGTSNVSEDGQKGHWYSCLSSFVRPFDLLIAVRIKQKYNWQDFEDYYQSCRLLIGVFDADVAL